MSELSTDERFMWHAYNYGWNRSYQPGSSDSIPTDPERVWFMPRLVEQAEAYFLARIIADKCVSAYGPDHCAVRWHKRGFVCFAECRARIPDYVPPQPETKVVAGDSGKQWRYRVAAAYRWAHDQGRTMPPGLDENCAPVVSLVAEYETTWTQQDQEREILRARIIGDGRNPDGAPTKEAIAYVELCSRQARANLTQFLARSLPPNWSPLARIQESLGLRATEREEKK